MSENTLAKVEQEAAKLQDSVEKAEKYANAVVIKTDKDQANAIKAIAGIEGEAKRIDAQRKFFVDPLNVQVKKINSIFKPVIEGLEGAATMLRRKLIDRQAQIAAEAEAAKAKVLADLEAGKIKDTKSSTAIEKATKKIENVKEAEKTVRTDEATTTFRDVKKVVIEDPAKLPREYLVPDEVKIRKVALAGVEIPGVKVIVEKVPSIKTNF